MILIKKKKKTQNKIFQKVTLFEICFQIQNKIQENHEIYTVYCTSRYEALKEKILENMQH